MNEQTPMFDCFVEMEKTNEEKAARLARLKTIEDHYNSLKLCWKEWNGPKVSDTIDGYCSVNTPIVYSITDKCNRYHYMAPCKILTISPDGETLEVEIKYCPSSTCAHYNGTILRLDITDVWAPTSMINKKYVKHGYYQQTNQKAKI
jgi:hypothetical protein